MNRDRVYALPYERVGDFAFDERVAEVFPDMIARSVPGYASILSMIEQLAARYAQAGSQIYDLGCSLGAATLLMRQHIPASCTIHAIDNSSAMVERLTKIIDADTATHPERCNVEVHQADIRGFAMRNASFVVLNLTLQFVPLGERRDLLQSAFNALRPGGGLLLSEKICSDNPVLDALLRDLHHDFKRAHGYSELEIAQKRTAIENQLIPETLETHLQRLSNIGFEVVAPWFQCFNFVSMLAVKAGESA